MKGQKGQKGDVGPPGAVGEVGAVGEKGDKGTKGNNGEIGSQGETVSNTFYVLFMHLTLPLIFRVMLVLQELLEKKEKRVILVSLVLKGFPVIPLKVYAVINYDIYLVLTIR